MQVDDSYAAYVAARWSTLYRLAALLVGPDRAGEVTGEALVRAYLVWPPRSEEGPSEDDVKAILGRLAADAEPEQDPEPQPGHTLRLATLPQRRRVVLVLRCFELLSAPDVARILGTGRDVVEHEADAVVAALEAEEQDIVAALAARADAIVVPFPPAGPLLARAHAARERRRRRSLRLTGVAGVGLAVVLGVGSYLQAHPIRLGSAPPTPASLAALDTGRPPRAVYAEGDRLRLPGDKDTVLDGAPTGIASAGRWTYVSFASGTVVRVDDDTLTAVPVTDRASAPAMTDQRGRYVAWVDVGHRMIVVQRADPGRHDGSERLQQFPPPARSEDPFRLVGLLPSADVVVSYPAESRAWVSRDAGSGTSDLHEIQGLGNGLVQQVTATELVVFYPPTHFAVGRLEHDAFLVDEDVVATAADFGDPTARRFVYADSTGHLHVGRRAPGSGRDRSHDLRLRLPRLASGWTGLHWEDGHHVLLDVSDSSLPRGALVRCDVASGFCEIAARFDGPHLLSR